MPFVGKACEAAGHIFVDKSGPKKVIETIEHARHVLQDGTSLSGISRRCTYFYRAHGIF